MDDSKKQVDFYILSDGNLERRLMFICRLIEKAHIQNIKALILVSDEQMLKAIDRMLWEFKPNSFIVHEVLDNSVSLTPNISANILIANDTDLEFSNCNFTANMVFDLTVEANYLSYQRIMIISNQNPVILKESRRKYKIYLDKNTTQNIHNIE